jgi:hypothetical protein
MNEEIIKLKSQAYDCLAIIERHQAILQQLNQKIVKLTQEEKKEEKQE